VTPPELDPSPSVLYERTGGGDAYRVAMLEHGHIQPVAPWNLKTPGKRAMQCGLVHEFNWSEWRIYEDAGRQFEGRYCRTCGTTQVRS
jgi:hypothetical protein